MIRICHNHKTSGIGHRRNYTKKHLHDQDIHIRKNKSSRQSTHHSNKDWFVALEKIENTSHKIYTKHEPTQTREATISIEL